MRSVAQGLACTDQIQQRFGAGGWKSCCSTLFTTPPAPLLAPEQGRKGLRVLALSSARCMSRSPRCSANTAWLSAVSWAFSAARCSGVSCRCAQAQLVAQSGHGHGHGLLLRCAVNRRRVLVVLVIDGQSGGDGVTLTDLPSKSGRRSGGAGGCPGAAEPSGWIL